MRAFVLAGFGAALLAVVPASAEVAVRGPFDVPARRAAAVELPLPPLKPFACGAVPAPVVRLDMEGFYADRGHGSSVVDKAKMASYRWATKAIDAFETGVTRTSDRFVRTGEDDVAECVLTWLNRWARADAMLDAATAQGAYVRKWGLAAAAAAYFKIRGASGLKPTKVARVRQWLHRWAKIVREEYSIRPQLSSHRNNHLYWAAWSVGLAAAALDDPDFLRWSLAKARYGIGEIDADGHLPLEMARKSRALHYHVFAAAPLVLTAELAARNGTDLYAEDGGALHRLVAGVVAGLGDPAPFARAAGVPQDTAGLFSGGDLGWLEAYVARFPGRPESKEALRYLARVRPAFNRWYGGDATLLYGAPATLP